MNNFEKLKHNIDKLIKDAKDLDLSKTRSILLDARYSINDSILINKKLNCEHKNCKQIHPGERWCNDCETWI